MGGDTFGCRSHASDRAGPDAPASARAAVAPAPAAEVALGRFALTPSETGGGLLEAKTPERTDPVLAGRHS